MLFTFPSRIVIPSTMFDKGITPQTDVLDVSNDFYYASLDKDRNTILVHYELGGWLIQDMQEGDEVFLYFNQTPVRFTVSRVLRYQALSPLDPYSNFLDMETGEFYTSGQLSDHVFGTWWTIQTCLNIDGTGRLFIQLVKQDRPPRNRR
jgi:hypothetical protein